MKGAESWVFSLFRVVEGGCGGERKARWQGFSWGPDVRREVCAEPAARCGGRLGGMLVAYGMVVLVAEGRSGTTRLGLWSTLRRAL